MNELEKLQVQVQKWIAEDPDPSTRSELERLIQTGAHQELLDLFRTQLEFGTAGLRGLLGAGPNRMNRAVVIRTTAGLCAWVKSRVPDANHRGICVGYDGRTMSKEFAEDVAAVIAGAGLSVWFFDGVVPTPILAYSVIDRNAAAGIMITASHNPAAYNGYKVYGPNGAQVIPPDDEAIVRFAAEVGSLHGVPRMDPETARAQNLLRAIDPATIRRYVAGVSGLSRHPEISRDIRIAYTALHGVGERYARSVFDALGFRAIWSVPEQAEPDATFPTVEFPNPEEKGAMDRVLHLAKQQDVDVVLANDPDADRLAVAVRSHDGTYVILNGNEIGCLLAHYLLSEGHRSDRRLVISTIVSSPMLGAIAKYHHVRWEQTLTGFKWIANRALDLEASGLEFVFGYEEALGYSIGSLVRDKDGIGAAAIVADMAAWCKSRGRTLLDELETAWTQYGLFMSRQVSLTADTNANIDRIQQLMTGVRAAAPKKIGPCAVQSIRDLLAPENSSAVGLPSSNVLILELEYGHRIILRPSGTEPKIKTYFDVRIDVAANEPILQAKDRAQLLLDQLEEDWTTYVASLRGNIA